MVTTTEKKERVMTMHGRLSVMARFLLNTGEALLDNEVTRIM